ncbi:uncharacterized protein LOC117106891 isoform X2 [Anneissia japonica]|nr:uncharacterized protein LOC117106891 isoform X2 [Anneissia japonica]
MEIPANQHNLERLREIIENGNLKQGKIFRKPSKKTCHKCEKTFLFGCNHCRLCEKTFCNECYIQVPDSVFDPPYSSRDIPQKPSMVKLCLDGYRQLLNERQTLNIQEGSYHYINQTIDALKRDIGEAIHSYNTTVTEIR